jgi:hypothetical protein
MLRAATASAGPVLTELATSLESDRAARWRAHPGRWTATGTAVFPVGPPDEAPEAVLRLFATGATRLGHEGRVLAALHADPALEDFSPLLPIRHAEGRAGRWAYSLDSYVPGVDATAGVIADHDLVDVVRRRAGTAITALHRATARPVRVGEEQLRRWVDEPVGVLARLPRRLPIYCPPERAAQLGQRLRAELDGRWVHAGWIHGDCWSGNVRVDPVRGSITGILDWDCAGFGELPAHDLLHLSLLGLAAQGGTDLGAVVAQSLAAGRWPAECEEAVSPARWAWGDDIADRTVLLLYWLRHVSLMAVQQSSYVQHSVAVWRWRNIERVVRCL